VLLDLCAVQVLLQSRRNGIPRGRRGVVHDELRGHMVRRDTDEREREKNNSERSRCVAMGDPMPMR
jgi:hypothetical protein